MVPDFSYSAQIYDKIGFVEKFQALLIRIKRTPGRRLGYPHNYTSVGVCAELPKRVVKQKVFLKVHSNEEMGPLFPWVGGG